MRSKTPRGVPEYQTDIYTAEAIVDPYPHYARLRGQGPVVWLSRQRMYALPRYAECKAILRDDKTFISGNGVALNPLTNRLSRGTTLNSDGSEHDERRKLVAHRMLPRALRAISDDVDRQAADVVDAALRRGEIDGVGDLAFALPLAVVPGLTTSVTAFCLGAQPRSTSSVRSTGTRSSRFPLRYRCCASHVKSCAGAA